MPGLKKTSEASHSDEHDENEGNKQQQCDCEMPPATGGAHHGRQYGEQQPGANVIDGSAGKCHCAEITADEISFFQNPCQHREGRNAHRGSHKQSEWSEGNVFSRKTWIKSLR